jgi:hypothetical protein
MFLRLCVAALAVAFSFSASAALTCADVLKALGSELADVTCFASTDLWAFPIMARDAT